MAVWTMAARMMFAIGLPPVWSGPRRRAVSAGAGRRVYSPPGLRATVVRRQLEPTVSKPSPLRALTASWAKSVR